MDSDIRKRINQKIMTIVKRTEAANIAKAATERKSNREIRLAPDVTHDELIALLVKDRTEKELLAEILLEMRRACRAVKMVELELSEIKMQWKH